jgi:DNA-binding transcriptional regulator YdaS (Cro superfamily)
MKTQQAIEHFGGIKQLADALGIWPHNISRWGEYPPMSRQFEIEVKTDGALKAEAKG